MSANMTADFKTLLNELTGGGYEFHSANTGEQARIKQEVEALSDGQMAARAAHMLMETSAEFRTLIGFLKKQTIDRPVWVAQLGLPMEQAYGHGCHREGQNSLFALILKMISEGAKKVPSSSPETSNAAI
jgi:hypothetical protein